MPTGTEPAESALVVLVPAADPLVAPHRERLDPASAWGVPAHVTVLYPFVHPVQLVGAVRRRAAEAVATVPRFACTFATTGWFDEDVVWLAPEPDHSFRALTTAVWEAFPAHAPYDGAHHDLVPHLTVASSGTPAERRAAESAVRQGLPVRADVHEVALLVGAREAGTWRVVETFPLG